MMILCTYATLDKLSCHVVIQPACGACGWRPWLRTLDRRWASVTARRAGGQPITRSEAQIDGAGISDIPSIDLPNFRVGGKSLTAAKLPLPAGRTHVSCRRLLPFTSIFNALSFATTFSPCFPMSCR
jgi:hypothetical protein